VLYIEKARERGLDVDDFAAEIVLQLGCHRDLFEEVAKYRAARRLFAKIVKERFQAKKAASYLLGPTADLVDPHSSSAALNIS